MALRSVHLLARRARSVTTLQRYHSYRFIGAMDPAAFRSSVSKPLGQDGHNDKQTRTTHSMTTNRVLDGVSTPTSRILQSLSSMRAWWMDQQMLKPAAGQSGMSTKQTAAIGGAVFAGFSAISGSIYALDGPTSVYLLGSFASSTALVFSAPDSDAPVSQSRNIVLGHALSAFVGMPVLKMATMFDWALWFSVPVAVTASVVAMHATRTFHPPAVSSGMTALIGSSTLQALGYSYVFLPCTIVPVGIVMLGSLLTRAGGVKYPKSWL
jgi:CBS-domain-containing membrane protein